MCNIFISCTQLTVFKNFQEKNLVAALLVEIFSTFYETNFLHCIHKLCQMNAVCALIPFKLKIQFNILLSKLRSPVVSSLQVFKQKLCAFHIGLTICPTNLIFFDLNIVIIYGSEDKL
jgi:hypothetical protein